MKKMLISLSSALMCLSITACTPKDSSSSEVESSSPVEIQRDIIFSEIVEGSSNNRALELYNLSDNDIDLSEYRIDIQLLSGLKTITFNDVIKAKSTYVIVYSGATEDLKNKANLVSADLMFIGAQPIKLMKGDNTIDALGTWDYQVDYCKDLSLVRKEKYLVGRETFDEYDWIRYSLDNYKYLGTIKASVTEEELLAGPKLTEEDLNRPYYISGENDKLLGGGGVMDVTVKSYVDGDTTCFYYDQAILDVLGVPQGTKLRYQNINTPESYEGNVMPFGIKAKEYTKARLSSAFDIKVQSILGGELTETYDRLLGWVWVDGELLNNFIVQMGYSNVAFSAVDTMTYKDVTYTNYLYNSELYARKHGKGIHGEKDPYWDYENNCPKSDTEGVNPNK